MANIDTQIQRYIEEYYSGKDSFSSETLFEMIEEAMSAEEEVVAVPQDEFESVKAELEAVKNFEENILGNIINQLGSIGQEIPKKIDDKPEDKEITPEDRITEDADRGGIEAQKAVARWLNETILDENYVAVTNLKGSGISDVTVISLNYSDDVKRNLGINSKIDYNYKGVTRAQVVEEAVVARFEVKNSEIRKGGTVVETAFFDKTVGLTQKGKGTTELSYFGPTLKMLAIQKNILFKVDEGYKSAQEFFDSDFGVNLMENNPEKLFNIIMTQGHFAKTGEGRCGQYGEMLAPIAKDDPRMKGDYEYYSLAEAGLDGVYASLDIATHDEANASPFQYYFYHGEDNTTGILNPGQTKKGTEKPKFIFFYTKANIAPKGEKEELINYYFKMTVKEGPFEIEFDEAGGINNKNYFGYTVKDAPGKGKKRGASTSGALSSKCFQLKIPPSLEEGEANKEVTNSRAVAKSAVEVLQGHWETSRDDYFVIAGESEAGYKLITYKTRYSSDPLNLNPPDYTENSIGVLYFGTFGNANVGQVRVKLAAQTEIPGDAIDVERPSEKIKTTQQSINEYYSNKEHKLTYEFLNNMIEEEIYRRVDNTFINEPELDYEDLFEEFEKEYLSNIDEQDLLQEKGPLKGKTDAMTVPLPRLVPTESWGDPTSDSYKQIKSFVLRAAGASSSIEGRFNHLLRVFGKSKTRITSPGRIISSLILLESLAAVLNSFSDSSAGFVYEGFLAALTFGKQVADKVEGSLPIEDIIAFDANGPNGVPASLKLLKGRTERAHKKDPNTMVADVKGTGIHGSFKNLVSYFDRYPAIEYIVTLKTGDNQLEVTSFEINQNNIVDVLLTNPANKDILGYKTREMQKAQGNWNELRPLLRKRAEWSEKSQWEIKQNQFRNIDGFRSLAKIDLSTESLKGLNEYWASQLNDVIISLFTNVKSLSENVNSFFLSENRKVAKRKFGPNAINNTKKIGESMSGAMSDDEVETP